MDELCRRFWRLCFLLSYGQNGDRRWVFQGKDVCPKISHEWDNMTQFPDMVSWVIKISSIFHWKSTKITFTLGAGRQWSQRQYNELDIQLRQLSRCIPLNFNNSASDVGLGVWFHLATKKLCWQEIWLRLRKLKYERVYRSYIHCAFNCIPRAAFEIGKPTTVT